MNLWMVQNGDTDAWLAVADSGTCAWNTNQSDGTVFFSSAAAMSALDSTCSGDPPTTADLIEYSATQSSSTEKTYVAASAAHYE